MKKLLLLSSLLVGSCLIFVTACQKQVKIDQPQQTEKIKKKKTKNLTGRYQDITINTTYNFLEIPDAGDMNQFLEFITGGTHADIQDYLTTMGFTSLGHSEYLELTTDSVTEEQAWDYIFNADRVFQFYNVVMKPIDPTTGCTPMKWNFLLTMVPSNLSSTSYEYLAAGTYDENTMNQFAANPVEPVNILDIITENPYGIRQNDPNSCPTSLAGRRFLGTGWTNTGNGEWNPFAPGCGCGGWVTTYYYTVLWFPTGQDYSGYNCAKCVN